MRKISWDKQALEYFRKSISYIRKQSDQNADKVKQDVFKKINELSKHPEKHGADKYKINNNGNYRAFEVHKLRISYLVKENEIIIARVRNTNQQPFNF